MLLSILGGTTRLWNHRMVEADKKEVLAYATVSQFYKYPEVKVLNWVWQIKTQYFFLWLVQNHKRFCIWQTVTPCWLWMVIAHALTFAAWQKRSGNNIWFLLSFFVKWKLLWIFFFWTLCALIETHWILLL